VACAAHVHVSIALSRTASSAFRCDVTYRFPLGLLVFAGDEVSIVAGSQDLDVRLKVADRSWRWSGSLRGLCRLSQSPALQALTAHTGLSVHCAHAAVAARIADIPEPYVMQTPHRLVYDEESRFRAMERKLMMHPQLSWTI
jgi:hypothetical protein